MKLEHVDKTRPPGRKLLLSVAALGVVYGDIGTSPLYAVRESFSGHFGVAPTQANAFGVLSLITWVLVIIVTIKYVLLVLRADNEGEGGILALTALLSPGESAPTNQQGAARRSNRLLLVSIGVFGAALLYGDGILTPAISVLSALEGVQIAAPSIAAFVVPITVVVLIGIFVLQRFGTEVVGKLFGPVMVLWFLTLAVLGVKGILLEPGVLRAANPLYAIEFLRHGGIFAFLVLGAVFLVATGAEALYADLGHFGKGPIRWNWFSVVFPSLLLNYYGQGALVLSDPSAIRNPFYLLAPEWGLIPLVVLSTAATVIASQAVITGVFSLTQQAVQLGYWPRMEVRHTSEHTYGQIYVPSVNWALMLSTIVLVLGFRSSGALAGAYGLAIILTMIVTTILLYVVAPVRWGWPAPLSALVLTVFLLVEFAFLGANLIKIEEGGWIPLLIAAIVFALMTAWRDGRQVVGKRLFERLVPLETFVKGVDWATLHRAPGYAVYMTGNPNLTPTPLIMNLEHQNTLHQKIILLSVATEKAPHVRRNQRIDMDELPNGIRRVTAHYGFMQTPDVLEILMRLQERGLYIPVAETTFFLGRERVIPPKSPKLTRYRIFLFSFLSRNSQRATSFFNIPADRVVEVGSQIEV